jgi:hypothetical protein
LGCVFDFWRLLDFTWLSRDRIRRRDEASQIVVYASFLVFPAFPALHRLFLLLKLPLTVQYTTQNKHTTTQHNTQCFVVFSSGRSGCATPEGWDGMEMVWRVVGAEMAMAMAMASVQTDRPRSLVTDDTNNLIIISRLGLAANILTLACRNIRHGVAVHS